MGEQAPGVSRRRRLRAVIAVPIALVAVIGLLIATVFINAAVLANRALEAQEQRLTALQAEVAELPGGIFAEWTETAIPDDTPWTRVQTVASHNSYAIAPNSIQHAMLRLVAPADVDTLAYSHPPLWEQFDQGIRSLELDLRVHANGDLRLTHVPVLANDSNAPDFRRALDEIALWSAAHPGHLPITLLIEFKNDYTFLDPTLDDWSTERLASVDGALQEGLGAALLSPARMSGSHWPEVGTLRGRVLPIMHPNSAVEALYREIPEEHRTMFIAESAAAAAPFDRPTFVVHNSPDPDSIATLVQAGAIVRTRADADLLTDPAQREHAFESGAQLISTDFPAPVAQRETGYTVGFSDGSLARVAPQ